jgi:CTP:molybdopterin cytidylyltransferase MocA
VIVAVVLAAGASSRYGVSPPKQVELLPAVLERLRAAASLDGILVVVGAHEVETDATTVFCPEWELGPGSALRCGLAALPPEADAALVVLADGPEPDPRAVDRVVGSWRADSGHVVAAAYAGLRLPPALLARGLALVPDAGARALEAVARRLRRPHPSRRRRSAPMKRKVRGARRRNRKVARNVVWSSPGLSHSPPPRRSSPSPSTPSQSSGSPTTLRSRTRACTGS